MWFFPKIKISMYWALPPVQFGYEALFANPPGPRYPVGQPEKSKQTAVTVLPKMNL